MADKPLTPLQIELREAMAEWGCPLCRLAARAEQAYIASVNHERVTDVRTREVLKASRGLCARHSRAWQALNGSALGIAIVYQGAVRDLLRDTERLGGGGWFRRGDEAVRLAERLEAHGPCPACILGEETARRFGGLLLKELASAEVQAALRDCGGLCLPHLRMVLRLPGAGGVYRTLIAVQREAWQKLWDALEAFIRKSDYRFRHEPMSADEESSWFRALDLLTGLER